LYGFLSAYDNLNYYGQLYRVHGREEKIKELLDFAGLSDKKNDKVGNFSKGMKRKLALARSLIFVDTKEVNKAFDLIDSLDYVSECRKEDAKLEVTLKETSSSVLLNAEKKTLRRLWDELDD